MMYIYKITNKINNKIYIGQTLTTIQKRWKRHIWNCTVKNPRMAITHAISKYGVENFIIEEIYKAKTLEELNEKEIFYIQEFNSLAPNGYNLTTGGYNKKLSEETKRKISESNKGKKASKETIKRLSESHKGHCVKDETKKKLSIINKAKTINQKVRDISTIKLSKSYILKKDETYYFVINMKKFAKEYNLSRSVLSNISSGKVVQHKGFTLIENLGYLNVDEFNLKYKKFCEIYNNVIYFNQNPL